MTKMKESFLLYQSMRGGLLSLPDPELRQMITAVFDYHRDGSEPCFSGAMAAVWALFKSQFERDNAKYKAICERNQVNGNKGGRPKRNPENPPGLEGTQRNPEKPQKADTDSDSDSDSDTDSDSDSESLFSINNQTQSHQQSNSNDDSNSVFSFETFWNAYGKKIERAKCEKLYAKIQERDRAIIAERLPAYVKSTPDVTYRKNPQTWLNGKCWNDEIIPGGRNEQSGHYPRYTPKH